MRMSTNEYREGRLMNGYDYENQAWVKDGHYLRCGHPEGMKCRCYGKEHEGEKTVVQGYKPIDDHIFREWQKKRGLPTK